MAELLQDPDVIGAGFTLALIAGMVLYERWRHRRHDCRDHE